MVGCSSAVVWFERVGMARWGGVMSEDWLCCFDIIEKASEESSQLRSYK